MQHFLITARVRHGSLEAVRTILREGPPFDLDDTSLERHVVFVADNEVAFLFEGPHAEREAGRLLACPTVLGQASRLRPHLVGDPRTPEEIFGWTKCERLEGLDFGPFPGPGNSDGGPID